MKAGDLRNALGSEVDFLRCMQLESFLRSLPEGREEMREPTHFEKLCLDRRTWRHTLSLLYQMLNESPSGSDPTFLTKWEIDLRRTFTTEQKTRMLRFAQKSSIANRYQENGYKILVRWYRTPTVLKKIFPQTSSLCWRCNQEEGTLLHLFWDCSKIEGYWKGVRDTIAQITGVELQLDPAIFLLHLAPMKAKLYKKSLLIHLLNAAKACIPACWKQIEPPTIRQWLDRVKDIQLMESMTQNLKETLSKFGETWAPWFEFLERP